MAWGFQILLKILNESFSKTEIIIESSSQWSLHFRLQENFENKVQTREKLQETPDYPTIVLGLHEGLQNRDIIVKTEPFCGLEPKNMVLNGSSTQREINMTDFICLVSSN